MALEVITERVSPGPFQTDGEEARSRRLAAAVRGGAVFRRRSLVQESRGRGHILDALQNSGLSAKNTPEW